MTDEEQAAAVIDGLGERCLWLHQVLDVDGAFFARRCEGVLVYVPSINRWVCNVCDCHHRRN